MNMRDTWSTSNCHMLSAYLVNRIENCLLEDDLFLPEDNIRKIFVKDFPPLCFDRNNSFVFQQSLPFFYSSGG